jgi:hypothetical protein
LEFDPAAGVVEAGFVLGMEVVTGGASFLSLFSLPALLVPHPAPMTSNPVASVKASMERNSESRGMRGFLSEE